MSKTVTLGGERLGSGNKNKIEIGKQKKTQLNKSCVCSFIQVCV